MKNFSICSHSGEVGLMKQLLVRKGGSEEKVKAETVLSAISGAKNKGLDPAELEDDFFAHLAVAHQHELRAQNELTMTHCSSRIKWGQQTGCQPSSFIGELDDEFIDHTSYDDIMGAEATEDDLASFFGDMKAMFRTEG